MWKRPRSATGYAAARSSVTTRDAKPCPWMATSIASTWCVSGFLAPGYIRYSYVHCGGAVLICAAPQIAIFSSIWSNRASGIRTRRLPERVASAMRIRPYVSSNRRSSWTFFRSRLTIFASS